MHENGPLMEQGEGQMGNVGFHIGQPVTESAFSLPFDLGLGIHPLDTRSSAGAANRAPAPQDDLAAGSHLKVGEANGGNAMKRLFLATLVVLAFLIVAMPAEAAIHEMVAAACNGKGELEPPGIVDPSKPSFLKSLLATGIITLVPGPGTLTIIFNLDHPASKYFTDGSVVVIPDGAGPGTDLVLDGVPVGLDHPSSDHCKELQTP